MIDLDIFRGKKLAIFGLGKSGMSTALALQSAGAKVLLWDDNRHKRDAVNETEFNIVDLRNVNFSDFDGLILSPGIPLTDPEPHWCVKKANAANIPILGDVELFLQAIKPIDGVTLIAITGTNGKSTTVSLVHHILQQAGIDAHLGGNIGSVTVLDMPAAQSGRVYVVELSSYQIDLMPSLQKVGFSPNISVLINISTDHIDRHGTIEHYATVKSQIFRCQNTEDMAIIGIDDDYSAKIANQHVQNRVITVSSTDEGSNLFCKDGLIFREGEKRLNLNSIQNLKGEHNLKNAAIAYQIGQYFDISNADIELAMNNFSGLEHRMEVVGEITTEHGDVLFINDSKATNAEAAKFAINSYENIYWIVGGQAKQGGLKSLHEQMTNIKKAYLFGSSAQDFARELVGVINFEVFSTMSDAINKALTDIVHGEADGQKVVLLSPAAASFDQFDNFEQRGNMFKKIAFENGVVSK